MIVGLTGGIGSGKTTILNFFKSIDGVAVYVADKEAKKLINTSKDIKEKLIAAFGEKAYQNNRLHSAYVADIVFKNPEKLQVLNKIVHPEVARHFKNFVTLQAAKKYIVYENAILFETTNHQFCDYIITVVAPLEERIVRVMQRDGCTREAVLDRIKNQFSEEKKIIQSHYIIPNNSLDEAQKNVAVIHNILTKKRF